MSRSFALLGSLLLAACSGDPSVLALQQFLGDDTFAADDLERLNRTFASEAIRAGAVAALLEEDGPSLYSPVVRGESAAPVDVRIWRERGLIDATGRFAPPRAGARPHSPPPALDTLDAREADDRASRLESALRLLAPDLEGIDWDTKDTHAIRLSEDGRRAQVNPRLLLLLAPAPDTTALAGLAPIDPTVPTGPEAGFHSDIKTGNRCVDVLFLVLLSPAWIVWHAVDLCGVGLCSVGAPFGSPSPLAAMALLPILLALTLARRRG